MHEATILYMAGVEANDMLTYASPAINHRILSDKSFADYDEFGFVFSFLPHNGIYEATSHELKMSRDEFENYTETPMRQPDGSIRIRLAAKPTDFVRYVDDNTFRFIFSGGRGLNRIIGYKHI